jgi:hypothetical protein
LIRADVPISRVLVSPNLKEVALFGTDVVVSEAELFVLGVVRGIAKRVP